MKNIRDYYKKKAMSRDCHCIAGRDRDSNFKEVIDEIVDYYENKIKKLNDNFKRLSYCYWGT